MQGQNQALAKAMAAERALAYVKGGMIVGLGTGSTAEIFVRKLGNAVRKGNLKVHCVATSRRTAALARAQGLELIDIEENTEIDVTVDGADEVSPELNLVKGLGGALLWEKIVAKMSKEEIIVVDSSKLVEKIGQRAPVPVEVIPFAWKRTKARLEQMFGCRAEIRKVGNEPFVSDSGNYILDCTFGAIDRPEELEKEIKQITGVVESGLFCGIAKRVIVGFESGEVKELAKP